MFPKATIEYRFNRIRLYFVIALLNLNQIKMFFFKFTYSINEGFLKINFYSFSGFKTIEIEKQLFFCPFAPVNFFPYDRKFIIVA